MVGKYIACFYKTLQQKGPYFVLALLSVKFPLGSLKGHLDYVNDDITFQCPINVKSAHYCTSLHIMEPGSNCQINVCSLFHRLQCRFFPDLCRLFRSNIMMSIPVLLSYIKTPVNYISLRPLHGPSTYMEKYWERFSMMIIR